MKLFSKQTGFSCTAGQCCVKVNSVNTKVDEETQRPNKSGAAALSMFPAMRPGSSYTVFIFT